MKKFYLRVISVIFLLCFLMNGASYANNVTIPLYIGAFFNLRTKNGYGALPMAYQAIDEINNNTVILPGYRLELVVNSTHGSLAFGQKVFQEFLNTGPRKIMLLGPVEDSLAKTVAAYCGLPSVRLLQFSYGTSDLELASRRDLYPYYFRSVTSLESLDVPRVKFIKQFGWDEVGIIYGDSVQYMKLSNQLKGRLTSSKIEVLAEVRLQANDPHRAVRTMKDKGVHVILGMFPTNQASTRKMICEAYRQKMYGPHYVWILLNSFNNNWWIPREGESSACSEVEMKCQVQNHFSFYHSLLVHSGGYFFEHAGKNKSQIISDYRAQVDNFNDTSNRSAHALNVYDAVWSIAFVLDSSRKKLEKDYGKRLENLTYGDKNVSELFVNGTLALDFPSPNIGGRMRYHLNGNRKNPILLRQVVLQDGKFTMISAGDYNIDTAALTTSPQIRWFAGTPYTKTTEHFIYRTIDRTLVIILFSFACLGIIYTLFCLIILVMHLKKKIIQNSAPVISILIVLGCLLNYITVILYGFDYSLVSPETVSRLCRARTWTFAIGFSLSVGGLAAKLWIAHSVLKNRFVRSKNVMSFWMLVAVVILFIFDVIVLACWEGTDALSRALKQVRSQPEYKCFEPITAETFRAKIEVVEHCDCANLTLWLLVILLFKALILVGGGFLAWQTRRMYIPALNDTQHCVTCMFVVILFSVIGLIVAFTTVMYPSVYYGVIGSLVIIATTIILLLLFINKIARLGCRRKGTKILIGGRPSQEVSCGSCGTTCAKFCPCCACSPACCITCCACFPCCNLYFCLRSLFFGKKVHPSAGGNKETKAEFYIGGVPQDRDAEIVYLKNDIREKELQLNKLGGNRTVKTHATQTEQDEDSIWSNNNVVGIGNQSDLEDTSGSDGRQRFRRAANKVKIFNEGFDYSHIRSKVDTGIRRTSMQPSSPQPKKGSRLSVSSVPNEELTKLRSTLAQKETEIMRLRKELEGQKSFKTATPAITSEQLPPKDTSVALVSKARDRITMTPPSVRVLPVSASSPHTQVDSNQASYDEVPWTKTGEKATDGNEVSQISKKPAQDRTNKKNSLGAAGAWLFDTSPEERTDGDKKDGHDLHREDENGPRKDSSEATTTNQQQDRNNKMSTTSAGIQPGLNSKSQTKDVDIASSDPSKSQKQNDGKGLHSEAENGLRKDKSEAAKTNQQKGRSKNSSNDFTGIQAGLNSQSQSEDVDTTCLEPNKSQRASLSFSDIVLVNQNDEYVAAENGNKKKTVIEEKNENGSERKPSDVGSQGCGSVVMTGNMDKNKESEKKKVEETYIGKNDKDKEQPVECETNAKRKLSSWLFGNKESQDVKSQAAHGEREPKKETIDENEIKQKEQETKSPDIQQNKENSGETNSSTNSPNLGKGGPDKYDEKTINSSKSMKQAGEAETFNAIPEKREDRQEKDIARINDRNEMEMIHEEDEDDEEYDDYDDDDDEGEHEEGEDTTAVGSSTKKGKKRRKRKKLPSYGKLNWKVESKVDTGGSYKPRKSRKKITNFKTDYSHVKSRLSTLSESNTSNNTVTDGSEERKQTVAGRKISYPTYSKVRPRLYNGVRTGSEQVSKS